MLDHLHAHIEHDSLPRRLHRPGLDVLEDEGGDEHDEIDCRHHSEAGQIARRNVAVDRDLRQVRRGQLETASDR